jgi:hypothetical protein
MREDKSPYKVDIGAKLEIKTEVPSDASGRLVNAVTDAVSPITEYLGLMGDRMRIHRRIVVNRLIRQAEEVIAEENRPITPVPTKIAVPLLEHASQEEPTDDVMIGLWAQLLASAAWNADHVSPPFVSLLSELNARQATLLRGIYEQRGDYLESADRIVVRGPRDEKICPLPM